MDLKLLAQKALNEGLPSLTPAEEHILYILFRKEIRKGAFVISANQDVIKAFCVHILASKDEPLRVIDFQRQLRSSAKSLAGAEVPVSSLVLYATWFEHWLNMMVTVAKLRENIPEELVVRYFAKKPTIHERLRELESSKGLSKLPRDLRAFVGRLVMLRQRYVHYSWKGLPAAKVATLHKRVVSVVAEAEQRLDSMKDYEWNNFDRAHDSLVVSLFPRAKHQDYFEK